MDFEKDLRVSETNIPGVLVFDLSVHGDNRGWFKENWQRAKMTALGLPDFGPVQNNISFNAKRGVTRGIHAEPWDKFISVATGSVFGAWVDLRPGSSFGQVFTTVLDPSKAIYIPRGVGNSFQALEDGTAYTYLVNAHWSAELKRTYTFVNLADPDLGIEWPIPLDECELSEADRHHPMLKDALPMAPRRTLVTGCNGQLGRAVHALADELGLPGFDYCDIDTFDMSDPGQYGQFDWSLYGTVINCGAYTAVDKAETDEGRVAAWKANATGPALLARVCAEHNITLVHVSSDYVFDGTRETHDESEPFGPLGVYGQSKAAGDLAVAGCPRHYILRSSWVIGEGHNFVRTMKALSDRVADPDDQLSQATVVDDQVGRLTFTSDMARAILHLLGYRQGDMEPTAPAPYGTYDLTGSGEPASWCEIARMVFDLANGNGDKVRPVSTGEYYASAAGPIAPRPAYSTLDLNKIETTGYQPADWRESLKAYIEKGATA
ncbi:sugar nucleotide-binding protein [Bifidobacterium phasiani]|uniref:dTDP-4-dehydrorhamnose reductase n=1 Tax=Bifidobacterium phasiani TaxID=2834431 RepID=A0ABS6W844_9BIFI|nr:sugar nucleotide-binding protein [Bifidobacterium phasiani]MBW3082617.1 sugar nucleotide-binding protein [Bifidobacterium phasiani]